jgi:hypothetical protein
MDGWLAATEGMVGGYCWWRQRVGYLWEWEDGDGTSYGQTEMTGGFSASNRSRNILGT